MWKKHAMSAGLFLLATVTTPLSASDDNSQNDVVWRYAVGIPRPIEIATAADGSGAVESRTVVRMRMPPGTKFAPHTSPKDRELRVLKGTYWIAVGDSFNRQAMSEYNAGAVISLPANTPHFFWARTNVVVEVLGESPLNIAYVHQEDDPKRDRE